MQISFCNRNDKGYKTKLNKLLKPVFLDFQFWYDLNLWDNNYESYSIMKEDEILSNICLYRSKIQLKNKVYDALSIGAVATKSEYRGKGYSRILMDHILNKYPDTPMYLSANESVIDFYPRFGFKRAYEKLPVLDVKIDNNFVPVKLRYDDMKTWDYVIKRKNFSKQFDCLNTASINLFHIHLGYLKHCIFEMPQIKTLGIAEKSGNTLNLIATFSEKQIPFSVLLKHLPFQEIERIEFGFTPDDSCDHYYFKECETDPLFVRNIKCDLGDFKFPELSIT